MRLTAGPVPVARVSLSKLDLPLPGRGVIIVANTLSKSAGLRSPMVATVHDLRVGDAVAMIWTMLNAGE